MLAHTHTHSHSLILLLSVCLSHPLTHITCSLLKIHSARSALDFVTRCNALQRTASHCNALQRTATLYNTLQHTTPYYNTLQYAATHCSTLQHTSRSSLSFHLRRIKKTASFRVPAKTQALLKASANSIILLCLAVPPPLSPFLPPSPPSSSTPPSPLILRPTCVVACCSVLPCVLQSVAPPAPLPPVLPLLAAVAEDNAKLTD